MNDGPLAISENAFSFNDSTYYWGYIITSSIRKIGRAPINLLLLGHTKEFRYIIVDE